LQVIRLQAAAYCTINTLVEKLVWQVVPACLADYKSTIILDCANASFALIIYKQRKGGIQLPKFINFGNLQCIINLEE